MPPRVVALVPARNEQDQIVATIRSIQRQTIMPVRIIVMADNCTDKTATLADFAGAEVYATVGNTARKAGALNQGFRLIDPDGCDFVLQMDADTELAYDFVERCLAEFAAEPGPLGGVCARCTPKRGLGTNRTERLLIRMQRIEYIRYDGLLPRRRSIACLSGAAVIYRFGALLEVAGLYGDGPELQVWNEQSLVEDYRLTIDVRHLGYYTRISRRGRAFTDAPTTLAGLWRQRVRWSGGTLMELEAHGWCRYTRREILTFLVMASSVFIRLLSITVLVAALVKLDSPWAWQPLWLIPLAVAMADRWDAIRRHEDAQRADLWVSLAIVPEELYGLLRESYTAAAAGRAAFRQLTTW